MDTLHLELPNIGPCFVLLKVNDPPLSGQAIIIDDETRALLAQSFRALRNVVESGSNGANIHDPFYQALIRAEALLT